MHSLEGRQNPPVPNSVDASTLIKTSQCAVGEKPANSEHVRSHEAKKSASAITAAVLRASKQRDCSPLFLNVCFSACKVATKGIIVGHAVEIHWNKPAIESISLNVKVLLAAARFAHSAERRRQFAYLSAGQQNVLVFRSQSHPRAFTVPQAVLFFVHWRPQSVKLSFEARPACVMGLT